MNIQEGPFQNFTAINFPAESMKIALYSYASFGDPLIRARMNINEQWIAGRDFSNFDFDRFLVGRESGAFIDWSKIPIDSPGALTGNAVLGVGVNPYWTGPYHNPITGDLYGFNDRPFIGVLRRDNRAQFYGWPREWHYCPAYDRKYTECVWTEGGAPGDSSNAIVSLAIQQDLPDVEYVQNHINGTTTLASTIAALAAKVSASPYVSATHVGGGTMRIENIDPETCPWVGRADWENFSYPGTAERLAYNGVITSPAPDYDFVFNGLQDGLFGVNFDLAEAVSFSNELPVEE